MKDEYANELRETTDEIELKIATSTCRKGKQGFRDRTVFFKTSWNEAQSYVGFIQSIVIFTALIPASLITVNGALLFFGHLLGFRDPFQFPLGISSLLAFIAIVMIFAFGIIAMRYLGTYRSSQEISAQMNPSTRLLWKKAQEILKRLSRIEKLMEEK